MGPLSFQTSWLSHPRCYSLEIYNLALLHPEICFIWAGWPSMSSQISLREDNHAIPVLTSYCSRSSPTASNRIFMGELPRAISRRFSRKVHPSTQNPRLIDLIAEKVSEAFPLSLGLSWGILSVPCSWYPWNISFFVNQEHNWPVSTLRFTDQSWGCVLQWWIFVKSNFALLIWGGQCPAVEQHTFWCNDKHAIHYDDASRALLQQCALLCLHSWFLGANALQVCTRTLLLCKLREISHDDCRWNFR